MSNGLATRDIVGCDRNVRSGQAAPKTRVSRVLLLLLNINHPQKRLRDTGASLAVFQAPAFATQWMYTAGAVVEHSRQGFVCR